MKVLISTSITDGHIGELRSLKSESAVVAPARRYPKPKPGPKPVKTDARKAKLEVLLEELAKVDAQLGKPATLKKHDALKAQIAKLKARPSTTKARVPGTGGGLPGRISGTLARAKQKQRTRSLLGR